MGVGDFWFDEEPGTTLQAPTPSPARRPKGSRFEVDVDVAEMTDRRQFGPVWSARSLLLSRANLVFIARRMVHPNRTLAVACHLIDDRPTPLFGNVVACEYVEGSGYRIDMDEIYPEMDVTVVPTIDPDPLPLAAIEPAVYGLPSITSSAGGLAEIVLDGVTGFQVPPGDVDALAERLILLLEEPARIAAMGERAWAENRKRFDAPVVIEQFGALLQSIADGASGACRASPPYAV